MLLLVLIARDDYPLTACVIYLLVCFACPMRVRVSLTDWSGLVLCLCCVSSYAGDVSV